MAGQVKRWGDGGRGDRICEAMKIFENWVRQGTESRG